MTHYTIGKDFHISIPDGWHEVSFNKGMELLRIKEVLKDYEVLAILCDIDTKKLSKATNLENLSYIYNAITFLGQLPLKKNPEFPTKVMGYDLPWVNYEDKFDLGGCEIGQVEDMKSLIINKSSEDYDYLQSCIDLVAIYMDKIIHGEYNYSRAIHNIDKYGTKVDFKTALNMGFFFSMRLKGWKTGKKNKWQSLVSLKRKSWRVFTSWVQRLVSMLPSIG